MTELTPALDRESQISKFSYGQFGIVRATDSQSELPFHSPLGLLLLLLISYSATILPLHYSSPAIGPFVLSFPVLSMH